MSFFQSEGIFLGIVFLGASSFERVVFVSGMFPSNFVSIFLEVEFRIFQFFVEGGIIIYNFGNMFLGAQRFEGIHFGRRNFEKECLEGGRFFWYFFSGSALMFGIPQTRIDSNVSG